MKKKIDISDKKLDKFMDVIFNIRDLRFGAPLSVKNDGSEEDLLAIELNLLSKEWKENKISIELLKDSNSDYQEFIKKSKEGIWKIQFIKPLKINLNKKRLIHEILFSGQIIQCNDQLALNYGLKESNELIGKRMIDLFSSGIVNDESKAINYVNEFIDNKFNTYEKTIEYTDKNSEKIHLKNRLIGVVKNGLLETIWGVQSSITEEYLKLEKKEKLYSNIFEKVSEGLMYSNENGNINMVNSHFCKMLKYTENELIGKNAFDTFHSEETKTDITDKIYRRKIGKSEKYEIEFLSKFGEKIWTEISSSPHINIDGQFLGVMSTITDITERKRKETELNLLLRQSKNNEALYRKLVADSPNGILLIEPFSNTIITANLTFYEMFGYSEDAIKSLSLNKLISNKNWIRFNKELEKIDGDRKSFMEIECLDSKGKIIYTDATLNRTVYGDGLSVIRINLLDTTKRKTAEISNYLAFSISKKASEKELSTIDFCKFIGDKISDSMGSTDFSIGQSIDKDTLSFTYIKDKYYKRSLPLIRKKGNGLSEYIIKTGALLLLNGKEIKDFLFQQSISQYGELPKSWIGAPILSKGKVTGVIVCQSYSKENIYNETHKQILTIVGSYLGAFFERKIYNDLIQKSEQRFKGLIENSSEITCLYDFDGTLTYASPSIEMVLGYKPEELIGKNIFDYLHENDIENVIEDHKNRIIEGGKGDYKVIRIQNKNKDWRHIRMMSSNQLENPSVKGFIVNATDVTEAHNVQKELETEHKSALQYQSMLLSSQLNPHFIFNSLNSIQYYILEKDTLPALAYLSNFATLMRSVLDNSTKTYITLNEEIKFLKNYLSLEESRHRNKFVHSIKIDENINPYDVLIPPMLLQPYIENTVIHGVGNLSDGGEINIEFKRKGEVIECIITDNGVGREKANELKGLRSGKIHNSFSTEITNSRLQLLNKLGNHLYSGEIYDLTDNNDNPKGTKVIATFPYIEEDQ